MEYENIRLIVDNFEKYLINEDGPFNHERNMLIEKSKYLDAFIEGKIFPPFEVEIQMSSKCNLSCRWCIGDEIQDRNYVRHLPDHITSNNIDKITEGIINYQVDGLGIELVKFSGFIGEPLLNKATLQAIQKLIFADKRVGLFTNGVFMDKTTWSTLSQIEYVHISLDAGRSSYFWLKERQDKPYSLNTFDKVIENIKGLIEYRNEHGSNLKINIGYVLVPGNHDQIYETSQLMKEIGADSIRFKVDIGDRYSVKNANLIEYIQTQFEKTKNDFESPNFKIHIIHSAEDIENETYKNWDCVNGCYFHNFLATIGSDANIYLCDHNSMPGAISLGHSINPPTDDEIKTSESVFQKVWEGSRRQYISNGIPYTCQCNVCPPFGNRINFFLSEIKNNTEKYGVESIKEALKKLRTKYS